VPAANVLRAGTLHGLARAAEARLRAGAAGDLKLIEVSSAGVAADPCSEAMGRAFETAAPDGLATKVAPGRYGLLAGPERVSLAEVAKHLESALRAQGVEVAVAAHEMPLTAEGLTPTQAARALRQALNVFARDGGAALGQAGFEGGLAGYIRQAGAHTASLRRVIRDGLFSLSFQPIVLLSDRVVHHFEALIRPESIPGCSLAEPQDFVMLVEALGLADELDLAVARLACDDAARTGMPVAFNLSGQSVQSAAFRERLHTLLTTNPARRAGLMIVEMTETAEIEDVAEARRTADVLRSLGVPFCLDDFGAGGADVRLLRALTPDIVKLDGSYIPGVTENGRERALVAGMVEIARGAGAEIVAERTETESEAEALRRVGVHYGQGWLFGRPGPLPVAKPRHPPLAGGSAAGRTGREVNGWRWQADTALAG
jgi:EAL domain-containing protein (putative c-di-GMP-specific phosphodiesterase class I)